MEWSLSKQGCAAVSLARILSCKKINLDFEKILKVLKFVKESNLTSFLNTKAVLI